MTIITDRKIYTIEKNVYSKKGLIYPSDDGCMSGRSLNIVGDISHCIILPGAWKATWHSWIKVDASSSSREQQAWTIDDESIVNAHFKLIRLRNG